MRCSTPARSSALVPLFPAGLPDLDSNLRGREHSQRSENFPEHLGFSHHPSSTSQHLDVIFEFSKPRLRRLEGAATKKLEHSTALNPCKANFAPLPRICYRLNPRHLLLSLT